MKPTFDPLTDIERAEALETLRLVLDLRPDARSLPAALREVASLRDMAWLARETGMSRTGLFRSLALDSNPSLRTIAAVLRAFGLRLAVDAIQPD